MKNNRLFPIFVIVTLLEVYVLVTVGQAIGGFLTILLVVITALIGSTLLKQQGFSILTHIQQKSLSGQMPTFEILEGLVVLIAGILLLTPGFITDGVGLLGLIPGSRKYFIEQLGKNSATLFAKKTTFVGKNSEKNNSDKTLEGEFWED